MQASKIPGMADALLSDYVSLGIIEDAAAVAPASAAAAKPASSGGKRPEPLKRVPWLASLKGIRSPLLRLHEGEAITGQQSGMPLPL